MTDAIVDDRTEGINHNVRDRYSVSLPSSQEVVKDYDVNCSHRQ